MDRKTEHIVRLRSGGVCEYCRLPEVVSHLPFPLDHIVARQHGGPSSEENLALSCPEWNSEVGCRSVGIQTFWFQAVCANHIVWDAVEVVDFSRKHTANVHECLVKSAVTSSNSSKSETRDAMGLQR
jgi:hypothetical protein